MNRAPPQRRRARARNGVAPYIPAAFCRDAGSAGHGATEAARPERSLQAGGFHASDRSDSPKPRQRVRRRLAGAPGRQDNTAVVRIRAADKGTTTTSGTVP
ncbi:hypothetical protein ACNAHZ_003261 [Escherichia coli]